MNPDTTTFQVKTSVDDFKALNSKIIEDGCPSLNALVNDLFQLYILYGKNIFPPGLLLNAAVTEPKTVQISLSSDDNQIIQNSLSKNGFATIEELTIVLMRLYLAKGKVIFFEGYTENNGNQHHKPAVEKSAENQTSSYNESTKKDYGKSKEKDGIDWMKILMIIGCLLILGFIVYMMMQTKKKQDNPNEQKEDKQIESGNNISDTEDEKNQKSDNQDADQNQITEKIESSQDETTQEEDVPKKRHNVDYSKLESHADSNK